MKKLLMVLLTVGIVSAVSAQPGGSKGQNDRGYSHNNDKHDNNYGNDLRERDRQIQLINRDFDQQIRAIRYDRFVRSGQKNRRINALEKQRSQQLSIVMQRFSKNSRYSDDYARNNRRF
jgi:hypothetical protein